MAHPYDPRDPYPNATTGPVGRMALSDSAISRGAGVDLSPASLDWVRALVAEQVAAERERIRQAALNDAESWEKATDLPGERTEERIRSNMACMHAAGALREFAATLGPKP